MIITLLYFYLIKNKILKKTENSYEQLNDTINKLNQTLQQIKNETITNINIIENYINKFEKQYLLDIKSYQDYTTNIINNISFSSIIINDIKKYYLIYNFTIF